jgi:hypothetical protein
LIVPYMGRCGQETASTGKLVLLIPHVSTTRSDERRLRRRT